MYNAVLSKLFYAILRDKRPPCATNATIGSRTRPSPHKFPLARTLRPPGLRRAGTAPHTSTAPHWLTQSFCGAPVPKRSPFHF